MKFINYAIKFILNNRRSGTTTLIKKIALENDCYVVVRYLDEIRTEYKEIKDKCITLEQLFKCEGLPKKPVIFETQAIRYICELAQERFDVVQNQNFKRDVLLTKIKNSLKEFELDSNDKIGSVSYIVNQNI